MLVHQRVSLNVISFLHDLEMISEHILIYAHVHVHLHVYKIYII